MRYELLENGKMGKLGNVKMRGRQNEFGHL